MLTLDQVRLLENRVEKAVVKITSLTEENTLLRNQLTGLQARVNELETVVKSFRDDQGRIEEGILSALDRLSAFEDSFFSAEVPNSTSNGMQEESVSVSSDSLSVSELAPASEPEAQQTEGSLQDDLLSETEWDPPENLSPSDISKAGSGSSDGQMDIF